MYFFIKRIKIKLINKKLTFFILILILASCNKNRNIKNNWTPTEKKSFTAEKVMAVTPHMLASEVAVQILGRGGNAFDAAVATQFALAVVYPQASSLGGGGFAVFHKPNGETGSLDFREKAPNRAKVDMFLDDEDNVIKGLSTDSGLSVGIPGIVDGMIQLHRRLGLVSFSLLLSPAIRLAEKGYKVSEEMAKTLNKYQDAFKKQAVKKHLFIKEGGWKAGDKIVQPQLANTLRLIQNLGRAGFYSGRTARYLVKTTSKRKGVIFNDDLLSYSAVWRNPIIFDYKDKYKVIAMGPPSSGGIGVAQILKSVEPFNLKKLGFQSSHTVQLLVEAMSRSFADRAHFLGDPDFIKMPVKTLISEKYLRERMLNFSFEKATDPKEITYGEIDKSLFQESYETGHFSIVDAQGNAVSITTTLNSNFGSKIFVNEAGFFLNNEMDDFSKKPNEPNQFGLIGTKANEIKGNKRMLSSMTPTIVLKDNKLFMVLGAPGGPTIITNIAQTILNVIEYNMSMQQAVDAPRFHHQHVPNDIRYEQKAIPNNKIKKDLIERGYFFKKYNRRVGQTNAILVTPTGLEGGADSRGNGLNTAAGY